MMTLLKVGVNKMNDGVFEGVYYSQRNSLENKEEKCGGIGRKRNR